ncbi:MAG: hypothetical protein R2751_03980 [Bacteroidales bacterium]
MPSFFWNKKDGSTPEKPHEAYAQGEGDNCQADQAKVAIVRGVDRRRAGQQHPAQPAAPSRPDFIYAIIIEEYGSLIGGVLVLFL